MGDIQSMDQDSSKKIEVSGGHQPVNCVLFAEDGKQAWSGDERGELRRWRVDDGHDVGEPIRIEGAEIYAAALSPDHRWLVCGLRVGTKEAQWAAVWDAQTFKRVLNIEGHSNTVFTVDVSFDSTTFVTGSADKCAFVWNLTTGERLLGPLQHDGSVVAVRFSPGGDRLATAAVSNKDSSDVHGIRIYDSEDGQLLLDMPGRFHSLSAALAWSADGSQLFAASYGEVRRFDASSGSLLNEWAVPGGGSTCSVILSHNEKFIVTIANASLSFWDASTLRQIGTVIEHKSQVWSAALSPSDDRIATGEENGNVTFRNLYDIISDSYFTLAVSNLTLPRVYVESERHHPSILVSHHVLPFTQISNAVLKSWTRGDFARVEQLLEQDIVYPLSPLHHAHVLSQRALLHTRLKQGEMAMDDAKKSIDVQRSIMGYIVLAIVYVSVGEHEAALRTFDLVFSDSLPNENRLLLLIKASMLFQCAKHDDALSRVDNLIDIEDDPSTYITVRAQMHFLLGKMSLKAGDNKRAMELFQCAKEAISSPMGRPDLILISLLFSWNFDRLAPVNQLHLWKSMYDAGHVEVADSLSSMVEIFGEKTLTSEETEEWNTDFVLKCITAFENNGDAALTSQNLNEAIMSYSTALALNPTSPVGLFVKRSSVRASLELWDDALRDADEAVKADSAIPWGYERRHAALHALQRYDEALDAFTRMHSVIEKSDDQDIRQLDKEYVSPALSAKTIDDVILEISKTSPLMLIDVKSGQLCNSGTRVDKFKLESEFKELRSSMTKQLDGERIQKVVEKYFEYVTLSHVWEGKEPSLQEVDLASSVWKLDSSSPLNAKLRNFCKVVSDSGYRWAWSDTVCIDKTTSTVLNKSLKMMYKWYEASAATFVYLTDVELLEAILGLKGSKWLTRAWTSQELLAPKVIRFYTRDWKPYRGDKRTNHKESQEIMQELTDAIGVARETIISFKPDDLSVREKLRLASTRNATVEEDVAYSLIGIFKSDIRPDYGEGYAALGHLLEEIVARSGEVTALDWIGKPSPYNSCLPASLTVYSQPPGASPAVEEEEMNTRVAALKHSLSRKDVLHIHNQITALPSASFANRRLHLPCVIFAVKRLGVQDLVDGQGFRYRARVSGIGEVDFQTSETLSPEEPRKLIFVHPWIRGLSDPPDGFNWRGTADAADEDEDGAFKFGPEDNGSPPPSPSAPSHPTPTAPMQEYTRALRLVARLQDPFRALLLHQQSGGEFKRVASERDIILPGIPSGINLSQDIHSRVVEVL